MLPDGTALNARRMLDTGIAFAAGSRHCDLRGDTAHTIPFWPAALVDDTVRNPPGMPPGDAVGPDVTVARRRLGDGRHAQRRPAVLEGAESRVLAHHVDKPLRAGGEVCRSSVDMPGVSAISRVWDERPVAADAARLPVGSRGLVGIPRDSRSRTPA